jgi:hypothetical protein
MRLIKMVAGLSLLVATCISPFAVKAQNEVPANTDSIEPVTIQMKRGLILDSTYRNVASGEFTPGRGFDIARSKFGSLNISVYALVRYLNQVPGNQTWYDHLGRPREFVGRNDFYWHRTMIWFSGFVGTPKLRYSAAVWTIMPTQQTLVYGNIQYTFNKHIQVSMGIGPNLSVRSMQGPFPFYSSTDRTMGEDALRGGFTQGLFVRGEIVPKLTYWLMLGNNLSTLGIQASKLTRDLTKSINLTWMPTTGEFGPRGGIGDFEEHPKMATRIGASFVSSKEDRFNNVGQPAPDNTQVRMTDGVLLFETGALANGITVDNCAYNMLAVDLGIKYRGLSVQAELYTRKLDQFVADGPTGYTALRDKGYSLQIGYMVVKQKLNVYGINSFFWDEFKRHPWEAGGGMNFYPAKSRSWRLNMQIMHVNKSAAGGTFGLYTAGQTGTTFTFGSDILL